MGVLPLKANSFDRCFRLTQGQQFGRVFNTPRVSNDRCFRVLARPNDLGFSRLGMAVSRRVSPLAVERNRLKRVIRESFRHHQAVLNSAGVGLDLVVLPSFRSVTISSEHLRTSLQGHWRKLPDQLRPSFEQETAKTKQPGTDQ